MVHTEARLADLGLMFPPAPRAAPNCVPCTRTGNLLFLSGHLPMKPPGTGDAGSLMLGKISSNPKDEKKKEIHDVEYGYEASKYIGLNMISTISKACDGDLDRVVKIAKIFGIVNSAPDFYEQHKVINGCSDLLVQVFGRERGLHARSCMGTTALPHNICVIIEAVVEIRDIEPTSSSPSRPIASSSAPAYSPASEQQQEGDYEGYGQQYVLE